LQKSLKAQQELEQQKQKWEREKIYLEGQLGLEVKTKEAEIDRKFREADAEKLAEREAKAEAEQALSFEGQASAYCNKLVAELRNLKILDMSRPLNLEVVYVQVRVREEEPPHYLKEEEIAALVGGEPTELLKHSQMRMAERAVVAMEPHDALAKFRRMSILGDPGAGKTTMLRYLALRMAQRGVPNLPGLPVYVELRRFVDSKMGNLLDFVASDWAERFGFLNARPYLEQQLDAGRASLLLDGLDEVLGGTTSEEVQATYNRVIAEINRLATRFPEAPIAVTCRRAGWRGGLTAFQSLEVLDFSWEQIQRFVSNWFITNPTKADGLRQALTANLRMQTLSSKPLILSLIAIVYEGDLELPERRAELYNRCVEVLVREWDTHRGIKRFSQFTTDRKRDLLQEIAWHFHGIGRRYFPEPELLRLIADFLPTLDIPLEENVAILDDIAAQYGLLKVQAHGWYGFLHLTLQEYFAAVAASERGATGLQEVVSHRHDPWWEEVILLLAGRLNDATPLLLSILGHSPEEKLPDDINQLLPKAQPLPVNDDLFHSDLLLAARCLVGTPRVRMRGLRDRIVSGVKDILLSSPHILDQERAARALMEIGGEALTNELVGMFEDNMIEPRRLVSVAKALGELGDKRIALKLLELVENEKPLDILARFGVMGALGKLGDSVIAERLLSLFERNTNTLEEAEVRLDLAETLGTLKAANAVPILLVMLTSNVILASNVDRKTQTGSDEWRRREASTRICEALGRIGDKSVSPKLLELVVVEEADLRIRVPIPQVLGKLGDKSVAPRLLQLLLDKKLAPGLKPEIADALKVLSDDSVARSMVTLLQDKSIEWEIRWLLTEVLEGFQERANDPLMAMLTDKHTDQRVRVGIAATLAAWGVRTTLPFLRKAIQNRIVPPSWELGTFTSVGRIWGRITRVLRGLGDDSVIPVLVELSERIKDDGPYGIAEELQAIVFAASEYKPEQMARSLLAKARKTLKSREIEPAYWSPNHRQEFLLRAIASLATKSLAPELVGLLAEMKVGVWTRWESVRIIRAITPLADDLQTINGLLLMINEVPNENAYYLDHEIYNALYTVSRRARVRVGSNRQIEPLTAKTLIRSTV
jgi:HEAT repeat protein